jgi:pilus assembly protein Flp/PilA
LFRFLKVESAATAIEYGLIVTGISLAIIAVVSSLGTKLKSTFSSISTQLQERCVGVGSAVARNYRWSSASAIDRGRRRFDLHFLCSIPILRACARKRTKKSGFEWCSITRPVILRCFSMKEENYIADEIW